MNQFENMCVIYWEKIQKNQQRDNITQFEMVEFNEQLKQIIFYIMDTVFGVYNGLCISIVIEKLKEVLHTGEEKHVVIEFVQKIQDDFFLSTEKEFEHRWKS